MARTLDVYLHEEVAGHLVQDDDGQMSFAYLESCLQNRVRRLYRNPCRSAWSVSPRRNAGDFSAAFCRKRANAKSSPANWASAHATTTPCLNRSAANVPER